MTHETQIPFGGVEVLYTDGDGVPQQRVLSPPTQVLELHLPTVEEIAPLRERFSDFVGELMTKENDPEYLSAYDNYQEVRDFYRTEIVDDLYGLFLSNYSTEDRLNIDTFIQPSQAAKLVNIITRYFGIDSILKALQDTQGALSGNE